MGESMNVGMHERMDREVEGWWIDSRKDRDHGKEEKWIDGWEKGWIDG